MCDLDSYAKFHNSCNSGRKKKKERKKKIYKKRGLPKFALLQTLYRIYILTLFPIYLYIYMYILFPIRSHIKVKTNYNWVIKSPIKPIGITWAPIEGEITFSFCIFLFCVVFVFLTILILCIHIFNIHQNHHYDFHSDHHSRSILDNLGTSVERDYLFSWYHLSRVQSQH